MVCDKYLQFNSQKIKHCKKLQKFCTFLLQFFLQSQKLVIAKFGSHMFVGTCIVISFSFCQLCFQVQQSGFHQIVSNRVVIRVRRKWKCSDSSNSDSVALVTPLTTPIFDFHKVISTLTTPLMIPTLTLWLVKTSL